MNQPRPATHPPRKRVFGLFVIRESDEHDHLLFDAMREQTYQAYRGDPAVDPIREAGLAPMDGGSFTVLETQSDGAQLDVEIPVQVLRKGKSQALLFHYRGYWHLWCQTSAYRTDEQGLNDFTSLLIRALRQIQPQALIAANFSRLVRSQAQGARLIASLPGNVAEVNAGQLRVKVNDPVGMMMLGMFATIASMERDWIVTRLVTGRIAKWRRAEWPFGHGTVPFGYELRAKKLVPVEHLRPAVREMLIILSRGLPPQETVRELDRVGVVSMKMQPGTRRRVRIGALTNATKAVANLYAWAPLYISGEYLFRMNNTFEGLEEMAGVEVVRHSHYERDLGEMQMLYNPGLPPGGWAESEVLVAYLRVARGHLQPAPGRLDAPRPLSHAVLAASAHPNLHDEVSPRERRIAVSKRGRGATKLTAFTGRRWVDGEYEYTLQMKGRSEFHLLRTLVSAAGRALSVPQDQSVSEGGLS